MKTKFYLNKTMNYLSKFARAARIGQSAKRRTGLSSPPSALNLPVKLERGAQFCSCSLRSQTKLAGTALIYVLLTIGVILSITFFLTSVFSLKLKSAFDYPNSVAALYAADSGVEWQLYNQLKDPDAASPSLTNGAAFTIATPPGSFPVKVIGKFRGVSRSIEISL